MGKRWSGYLDGNLKVNLDGAKEAIKKNWDMFFIIDGYEGSGKSVLAQQLAAYCDPTFNLDRIVFTPEQCQEAINNSERFQSIVYDEAFGGLNALQANLDLLKTFTECRRRNLFLFVVLPSFFDLKKSVAIHRARALIHVYTGDNFTRGLFRFYNKEKKKYLYVLGKKFYDYSKTRSNFYGRFLDGWIVNEEAYDRKKYAATTSKENTRLPFRYQKYKDQRDSAVLYLLKTHNQREVARITKMSKGSVQNIWSNGQIVSTTEEGGE